MAFFIEKMTADEIKEGLKQTKTVIVPVGVVEQHGFHLPLSTDIINATAPIEFTKDRLNAFVAPCVNYSYSGGELSGTINVSAHVFALYVAEICQELANMGFKNFVIIQGHGGSENRSALKDALGVMLQRNEKMRDATVCEFCSDEFSKTAEDYILNRYLPEHDFHAGVVETSMILYWKGDLVHMENMELDAEPIVRGMRTDPDWYEKNEKRIDSPYIIPDMGQREEIRVGVMGFPQDASKELGKKLCDEVHEGFVQFIEMLNNNTK